MSMWMNNFETLFRSKQVIILHNNVRDRYIDRHGGIYQNLTDYFLHLTGTGYDQTNPFQEIITYDFATNTRRHKVSESQTPAREERQSAGEGNDGKDKTNPVFWVSHFARDLYRNTKRQLVIIYYLDKLIPYQHAYNDSDRRVLLFLEKAIENIAEGNRLIMVSLLDTMIPVELYNHSPKCSVIPIPIPDAEDRHQYLRHHLHDGESLRFIANLTEGMYLRELDPIINDLRQLDDFSSLSQQQIRQKVNIYRIGESEDYWGKLDIKILNEAARRVGKDQKELNRHDADVKTSEQAKSFDIVRGQDEAVQKVIDVICIARSGLSGMASGTVAKPKGVLFFAGPTGVGKTFLAKRLTKFLFGTEDSFIRIDMSELKESHSDSKLIGSPPGYVGHERGGMLTTAVLERPYSVILFDEIDKAHQRILDIFLQILDEGRLTDSRGQTVYFTETVIIFTSNIGARERDKNEKPISESDDLEEILKITNEEERQRAVRKHFREAVERFFKSEISRPELLNRIGNNIIPFNHIDTEKKQIEIIQQHLTRIESDFADKYRESGYDLTFDPSVAEMLVGKHREDIKQFGGRGITNAIEHEIMAKLAQSLLNAEYQGRSNRLFHVSASDHILKISDDQKEA